MENREIPKLKGGRTFLPKMWIKQDEGYRIDEHFLFYIDKLRDEFVQNKDTCALWFYSKFRKNMPYGKNIRKIHNRWWQSYLDDNDLQQSLDLLGFNDIDKKASFFYYFIYVRFYAWTLSNWSLRTESTQKEIERLIQKLDKLKLVTDPNNPDDIHVEGNNEEITLTCTNNIKDTITIKDTTTLYCIKMALKNLIENNPEDCEKLLNYVHPIEGFRKTNKDSFLCYWFHKYVYWLLKEQRQVDGKAIRCDRWMMVSEMIYHIKLIDDKRFLEKKASQKIKDKKTGRYTTHTFGSEHLKGVLRPAQRESKKKPLPTKFDNLMWDYIAYENLYFEGT